MPDLYVTDRVVLPHAELSLSYSRSGGPGGQHVNTTETRVQLRWAMADSDAVHPAVKRRLAERFPSRVTTEGDFLVTADGSRSRHANIEEAHERLSEQIRSCLAPPKRRRATRPTRASQRRRVESKKKRGKKKKLRGPVGRDD